MVIVELWRELTSTHSPEYRSSILDLKVKAVDKPGIIPAPD